MGSMEPNTNSIALAAGLGGFEATGYFRMEKDERWWMVTPDGNAFLSFS